MSRQIDVVVQGTLGTTPSLVHTSKDRLYCHFRLATTPTYRVDNEWREGDTLWFTAKAWGALARNLAMSLRKGDPVVLVGRFTQETWRREDGSESLSNVLTVSAGGHDLTRGESRFMKVAPPPRSADSAEEAGMTSQRRAEDQDGTASSSTSLPVGSDERRSGGEPAASLPGQAAGSETDPWEVPSPDAHRDEGDVGARVGTDPDPGEGEPALSQEPAAEALSEQGETALGTGDRPRYVVV
ncbi:single-stranded DNA-binding protein [Actinomyces faecalis]|uniref:single-stranded DNA-binding protein n=1 Tax=Actinomyces faecalis TaxID=2722820 RepID=UPI00155661D2|nr:single-stranded DNA-binding protein [Actinomyces faecalis]